MVRPRFKVHVYGVAAIIQSRRSYSVAIVVPEAVAVRRSSSNVRLTASCWLALTD